MGGRPLSIDHCHDSGYVRGVLCQPCNIGLGGFRDRVDLLLGAVGYLTRSNVWIEDHAIHDRVRTHIHATDRRRSG